MILHNISQMAQAVRHLVREDVLQISHTLPTTRHRCNLQEWALARRLAPLTRDTGKDIKRV